MELYHASRLSHIFPEDVGNEGYVESVDFAYDPSYTTPYLFGEPGYLHTVRLRKGLVIATEDDIMDAVNEGDLLGCERDAKFHIFEIVDRGNVIDALIERGFHGAEFMDLGPDNEYQHETVKIFTPGAFEVVDTEYLPADEEG